MAEATPLPSALSPQFCFSTVALRDFLRLSRATIDDSITQNLNALLTPSQTRFNPASTSTRSGGLSSRQIPARACQDFQTKVLFPSWQSRSDILTYCASVALSPDPEDPDAVLQDLERERDKERVVNERLDPYSARNFPRETRAERLATLLRQEQGVENIIRTRTWEMITDRCGVSTSRWQDALDVWRRSGNTSLR